MYYSRKRGKKVYPGIEISQYEISVSQHRRFRRRTSLLIPLLVLAAVTAYGIDMRELTSRGDRSDNQYLLDSIRRVPIGEAMDVIRGLEERSDRFVGDILTGLARDGGGRPDRDAEYLLLRILEAAMFRSDGYDEAAREENREAVLRLAGTMDRFGDRTLRTRLLSASATLRTEPRVVGILVGTGVRLLEQHRRDGGMGSPDQEEEILSFFQAALAHPARPLGDICLDLVAASRMKRVVDAGRITARHILQVP